MKTVLTAAAAAVLLFSTPVFASPYHYHRSYWHQHTYYAPRHPHCGYLYSVGNKHFYSCHY